MVALITQIKKNPEVANSWHIRFTGELSASLVERFPTGRVFCWSCCSEECEHVLEARKIH